MGFYLTVENLKSIFEQVMSTKLFKKKEKCFCVEICLAIYTKCSTATIMVHNSDDVNVLKRISYKSLCTLWGMAGKMGNYNHMVSGTLF